MPRFLPTFLVANRVAVAGAGPARAAATALGVTPIPRRPLRPWRTAALVACLALALVAAVPARADNATALGVTLTAGPISISSYTATAAFNKTLNGTDQVATYLPAASLTDGRGSGVGWNMTITSTQFTTSGGATLPATASTITSIARVCGTGFTCTLPNTTVTPPAVPAAATAPTPVKFFNATADTGMGRTYVAPTVQVQIPANTVAGTYTSTVSIAFASGP